MNENCYKSNAFKKEFMSSFANRFQTSSWVAGSGNSRAAHKEAPDSENSDIQSLASEDYTDGRWSVPVPRALAGSEEGREPF